MEFWDVFATALTNLTVNAASAEFGDCKTAPSDPTARAALANLEDCIGATLASDSKGSAFPSASARSLPPPTHTLAAKEKMQRPICIPISPPPIDNLVAS